MIPVARVSEPKAFDKTTRKPGALWLKENPAAKRPHDYWSPHLEALAKGFSSLCGYAAMLDPTGGTVDHYLSFRNHPKQAYEWSNYRFASQVLNSSKRTADDTVLDPYLVGAGWFEILLPSLQMKTTANVPVNWRAAAEYTLGRLKLRNGAKIVRWRRQWYAMYEQGQLTLDGLRAVAPLLADAVVKAGAAPAKKHATKKKVKR